MKSKHSRVSSRKASKTNVERNSGDEYASEVQSIAEKGDQDVSASAITHTKTPITSNRRNTQLK